MTFLKIIVRPIPLSRSCYRYYGLFLCIKQNFISVKNSQIMENQQKAVFVSAKIKEEAKAACSKLIPEKSKENYVREYELFEECRKEECVSGVNEDIVLAYLYNYRKRIAPSSLWTKYSMLKSTCRVYKNIDISKYGKVISYLKSEARTHKSKKANILEREHIQTFLKEACDSQYLMAKAYLNFPLV